MKFEIKKGDIFKEFEESNESVMLCHGCNCQNLMGAGIAKIIAERYPLAYQIDTAFYSLNAPSDPSKFGKPFAHIAGGISYAGLPNSNKTIANCYTQVYPGKNFQLHLLENCLGRLSKYIKGEYTKVDKVLFPAIGCGIGGGNFDEVVDMIYKWFKDEFVNKNHDITIVIYMPL